MAQGDGPTDLYTVLAREIDQRIDALRRELDLERVTVSERMEKMTEARDQLREQAGTFARRDYVDGRIDALESLIEVERAARLGQMGAINTWRWIAGLVGLGGLSSLVYALLQQAP